MPMRRRVQIPGIAKDGRANEPSPPLKKMSPGNQQKA